MSRIALVWVLSACLVATGVAGCGAVPSVNPNDPRLQVTPSLREACADFAGDALIDTLLIAYETDRLRGFTWTESRLDAAVQCNAAEECIRCANAVIDQVYGVN